MIYFSTSELSGDSKTRKAQDFFYLFNDWAHFVASELKVTNPLGKKKKRKGEGVNAMFMKETSSIALNTKVFL